MLMEIKKDYMNAIIAQVNAGRERQTDRERERQRERRERKTERTERERLSNIKTP